MCTRAKKIGRKVMAGGENRMMQPAASRCGQMAQVDRFVADVVEKDTIHIHQRSLVVLTVMTRVLSDVASVMVRVPELVADVTVLEERDSLSRVYTKRA
ncbi:hypothetical protein CIK87_01905 [Prevotella sp. P5-64]|nr:hypothetical protein CIK87_01905 [Prevotella sp. P5-64]